MSDEGKYRINTVSEMTGIPAATLRAWERRYGLPEPQRTNASYRVYSDADVAAIRRVRALCDEGMAPSEATKVVLADIERRPLPPANDVDAFGLAACGIVEAVEAFEPARIERAVLQGMSLGSATAVFDRVLRPAMVEIGDRWHAGTLSVGQEHLATQIIQSTADAMLRLVQREDPGRTVVIACFPEETHTLPSYGFALHMASWGFGVVRLGSRTPAHAVRQAVEELSPSLVGLSAIMTPEPYLARTWLEDYAAACGGTPWVVGGAATPALAEQVQQLGGVPIEGYEPRQIHTTVEALLAKHRRRG